MAGADWSLEQCFQALNVPISDPQGQGRSLDELVGDEGYRMSLWNYFSDDGMTLYAILNVSVVGDVEAVKAMWANEPESMQRGFKTLSDRFCGGGKLTVRSFAGQWLTIPSLWQGQDTAAPRRNIVWARVKDDRTRATKSKVTRTRVSKRTNRSTNNTKISWSLEQRATAIGLPRFDFILIKSSSGQQDWSVSPRLLSEFGSASKLYALTMVPTIYANIHGLQSDSALSSGLVHAWNGLSQVDRMEFENWATIIRAGGAKDLRVVLREMLPAKSLPKSMTRGRNAVGTGQINSLRQNIATQAFEGELTRSDGAPTAEKSEDNNTKPLADVRDTVVTEVSSGGPVARYQPEHSIRLQPEVGLCFSPTDRMRPDFADLDLDGIVADFDACKLAGFAKSFRTGRDLFDYHIYPVICRLLNQSVNDPETEKMASQIWKDFLPDSARGNWTKWLRVMQDQAKQGSPDALYKLALRGSLEGEEDLSMMVREHIMDHVNP